MMFKECYFLQNHETPLYWAASNGHHTVVELLLKAKANPNITDVV